MFLGWRVCSLLYGNPCLKSLKPALYQYSTYCYPGKILEEGTYTLSREIIPRKEYPIPSIILLFLFKIKIKKLWLVFSLSPLWSWFMSFLFLMKLLLQNWTQSSWFWMEKNRGGRGHWTVNHIRTQIIIIILSYALLHKLLAVCFILQ